MIIRLDPDSPVPPYAQLKEQVTTMIRSGVLAPDTRLPAIRHLAADLGVATGTVARAYRELEAAGLVATRGRHGTVVQALALVADAADDVAGAAEAFALEAAHRGVDLDRALDAVRAAFAHLDSGLDDQPRPA
ncbi:MAG TPA: GntR family transcriptional regulator [Iamia sp.]|nr:GntR family transcriptional regulator [Iamia sp.]